ncbi:unnamed protein product [Colias eurytheme]|nr:unnamed protein product [Colias eurytheme]
MKLHTIFDDRTMNNCPLKQTENNGYLEWTYCNSQLWASQTPICKRTAEFTGVADDISKAATHSVKRRAYCALTLACPHRQRRQTPPCLRWSIPSPKALLRAHGSDPAPTMGSSSAPGCPSRPRWTPFVQCETPTADDKMPGPSSGLSPRTEFLSDVVLNDRFVSSGTLSRKLRGWLASYIEMRRGAHTAGLLGGTLARG